MIENKVSRRYARALFELADEAGLQELVYSEIAALAEAVYDPRLKRIFLNPVSDINEKKSLLLELVDKSGFHSLVRNFALLLLMKNRLVLIDRVADAYRDCLDDKMSRVTVRVSSARKLAAGEQKAVKERMTELTGKEVRLDLQVDPGLIGGVLIEVGSRIFDGTIAGRLGQVRRRLLAE